MEPYMRLASVALILLGGWCLADLTGQETDSPSKLGPVAIERWLERLRHGDLSDRQQAEQQLQNAAAEYIDLIPEPTPEMSPDVTQRLTEIRRRLLRSRLRNLGDASHVTLQGRMKLSDALTSIQQQTMNQIVDYRDRFGQPVVDPFLTLNAQSKPFWRVVDELFDQAGVTTNPFVGVAHQLSFVARPDNALNRSSQVAYSGAFRVTPIEIAARRSLQNPNESSLRLTLEVMWEPRLAPIQLRQRFEDVSGITSDGTTIELASSGTIQLPVETGIASEQLHIPLVLPPQSTGEIAVLRGTMTVLIPDADVTFEFQQLEPQQPAVDSVPQQQRKGDVTVSLLGARRNGGVMEIRVSLRFEQAGEALQSHLGWVEHNKAMLVSPSGEVLDKPGLEKIMERESEVGYAYIFPFTGELDGYSFRYKTPSGVALVPVTYELSHIPLP